MADFVVATSKATRVRVVLEEAAPDVKKNRAALLAEQRAVTQELKRQREETKGKAKRFKRPDLPKSFSVEIVHNEQSVDVEVTPHTKTEDVKAYACKEFEVDPSLYVLRVYYDTKIGQGRLGDMSAHGATFTLAQKSGSSSSFVPQKAARASSSSSSSSNYEVGTTSE